ncbi:hypothetical protein THIOM_002282 [Candidatus Thiomargarita nelsonii]|uniref:Uncharacterized protein n=1 Tax=Candidatus Thiomargarita nelsonii TaxID=1003181 RepID=A0A176S1Y8_9GAMM|nr:hypothetical protein THIOM_002282 [Candidatus Thiomargarita nelsonii]
MTAKLAMTTVNKAILVGRFNFIFNPTILPNFLMLNGELNQHAKALLKPFFD